MTELSSNNMSHWKWREFFSTWGFFLVISAIALFIFFDFFTKGYVMEGMYDRRNNTTPYYLIFSIAAGNMELPQWNPFFFCGNTLLSNSTYSFFYPFNWPIWLAPVNYIHILMTFILLVHFLLAAYFMRLLLRELTGDPFWTLCGTVAYVLSPPLMLCLFSNTEPYQVFVYLPALLYLIKTIDSRSRLANILLQSAAYAMLMLGGMVQYAIYAIGIAFLFVCFSSVESDGKRLRFHGKPLATASAGIFFGLLLSAVRLIPFFISTSSNATFKLGYEEFIKINSTPLPAVSRVFLPEFFIFLNRGEYFDAYAGLATAVFALYAFFLLDKKTLFWKSMFLTIALIVIGTPLAYVHYILLGKSNLAFGRLAMFIPLCLSVLFCYTGMTIMEDDKHLRRFISFAVIAFIVIMAFAGWAYFDNGQLIPTAQNDPFTEKEGMRGAIMHFAVFFSLLLASLIFLARSKTDHKSAIFKTVIFSIVFIDLFLTPAETYLNNLQPSFVPEPYYTSSFSEKSVSDQFFANNKSFRILGYGEGTSYSRSVSLDLYTSGGYESTPPLYIQTLYTYPYTLPRSMARHITPQSARTLQLSSTKYIIHEDGSAAEVFSSLPRYSLYNDFAIIPDDRVAIETILGMRGNFDIARTVVLSKSPAILIQQTDTAGGQIRLTEEKMNSLSFDVASPGNTLLLLNDTFDKGWRAFVDGAETEILRANYAFRSVPVPHGVHRVNLVFSQRGFREGLMISSAALCIFLALLLFHYRDRLMRRTIRRSIDEQGQRF